MANIARMIANAAMAVSIVTLVIYGNILKTSRPVDADAQRGFVHPFFLVGNDVFVSTSDQLIMLVAFITLVLSLISLIWLNRPRN